MRDCVECGKSYEPKTNKQKYCSPRCNHDHWIKTNRESYNAYMNQWRKDHPERMQDYVEKRRVGWQDIECARCGKTFQQRSGPNKFCSAQCRGKARRSKPEEKEKRRASQQKWRELNGDKNREYHREYFPKYIRRKLAVQPWIMLLRGAKSRAKKQGLPFDLDAEWAAAHWDGKCEVTRLPFSEPAQRTGRKRKNFSPSIDKIIPTLGYVKSNCRIVLWGVNALKCDHDDADMLLIAKAISNDHKY